MDFLSGQVVFNTSKKYESIYIELNEKYKVKYHELFTLSASIGFKKNLKRKIEQSGREFRSSYLNDNQRTSLYIILLESESLAIDDLYDNERFKEYKKILESYAEGGIEYLVNDVLPPNIEKNTNVKYYDAYLIDIMTYIAKDSKTAPF